MNIEALNCRCCGGVLNVKSSLCVCDYCGATNFISDVASKYINQLNRANKLRQEREFDNAARIYDTILEENPRTADILWLRTLCEYGIEYVPDPVSDKYFPTLHRINDESILSYHFYTEALSLAKKDEKESLQKEAEYINTIQNEYLHIAENEAPYDIFICYKETDEDTGEKTEDVELAASLYEDLTSRGFKVFFAKETLKTKLSIDYEPYIFAALKSSKAMIVLGTKAEYFMSVWVKNEWGRFLKLMQDDDKKQMFFACDDPEELPRAFATKQAQLLGSDNALKNLADNVERFLKNLVVINNESERDRLYNKALSYVRARNDFAAKPLIDRFIAQYPDYAPGYWLRLLNKNKANSSLIIQMPLDLYPDEDYKKAIQYADSDLKEEYTDIAAICKKNLVNQQRYDRILQDKSLEFVRDFDKTESGQKKTEVVEKILRNAITVDIYNDKLRRSTAIGLILFILGTLLLIFLEKMIGLTRGFVGDRLLWVTLLAAPIIIAGIAVLLSYNLVIDLIVCALTAALLIASIFVPFNNTILLILVIILPIMVYLTTNKALNSNKTRNRMVKASLEIDKSLDELSKVIGESQKDMDNFANKLLKEYKEENNINSIIEINDKSFKNAQKKIERIYLDAEEEYTKYIGVSIPSVRSSNGRKESELGVTALILAMIPFLGLISFVMAIIDIASDKYKEHTHLNSIFALMIDLLIVFIMLFVLITI